MLFCDRLFEMLEFEESLYFTALDVEFHSQTERVSSKKLYDINLKHFGLMTVNQDRPQSQQPPVIMTPEQF